MDIRPPNDAERDALISLLRSTFGQPDAWAEAFRTELRLDWMMCAFEDDDLVATSQSYPLHQWFGGRPVPMAGIAGVATRPERRGTGVGREVLRRLLERERERGAALSTLYPATVPVYRSLGYEYAGSYTRYRVPLRDLPRSNEGAVERFTDDDVTPIMDCFGEWVADHPGAVSCDDPWWWRMRILRRWGAHPAMQTVVVRRDGTVRGYACYEVEPSPGVDGWGTKIDVNQIVANDADTLRTLLGYFRRFQGIGQFIEWAGAPAEPVGVLLEEQTIEAAWSFRNMSRVLDVARALEARGYGPVDAEVTFALDDALFPENAGPWRVTAHRGDVSVERTEGEVKRPIPVGSFSAMFTGYLSARDLARVGAIEPGDDVAIWDELFAGPAPWSPDFF